MLAYLQDPVEVAYQCSEEVEKCARELKIMTVTLQALSKVMLGASLKTLSSQLCGQIFRLHDGIQCNVGALESLPKAHDELLTEFSLDCPFEARTQDM